jgi:hypothetical protein
MREGLFNAVEATRSFIGSIPLWCRKFPRGVSLLRRSTYSVRRLIFPRSATVAAFGTEKAEGNRGCRTTGEQEGPDNERAVPRSAFQGTLNYGRRFFRFSVAGAVTRCSIFSRIPSTVPSRDVLLPSGHRTPILFTSSPALMAK